MKRTLLFVLGLIAAGCAEPIPRNLDNLSMQGPQYLDPETLEPYSGPAYRRSEDDSTQIVLRVNLRDGRFHGDFEDREPEGFFGGIYETGTYRDGQREGRFENFYPGGVFKGRGTYENGLKEGPDESYYENGQISSRGTYRDGQRDGPSENYNENGQLFSKWSYKDGERHGPSVSYHSDGRLWATMNYNEGRLQGPFERYGDNGQLYHKGTYLGVGPERGLPSQCGESFLSGRTRTYPPCPPGLEDGN